MSERGGVWALVLAAGSSRRFGGDKLTVSLGKHAVAESVLDTVVRARASGVIRDGVVVVRERRGTVAVWASVRKLRATDNPIADQGIGTSLSRGLAWLENADPACSGALVLLADQPLVRVEIMAQVVARAVSTMADVVRVRYEDAPDEPGHPVFIRRSAWSLAKSLDGDQGLRQRMLSSPLVVESVRVAGSNPDLDTREDLIRMQGASDA